MLKSLLGGSSLYLVANVTNAAIPFLLLPILTRELTTAEYGIYAMYQVLVWLATPLVGISTHSAVARRYIDRDEMDFPRFVGSVFVIAAVSLAVVMAGVIVFGDAIFKVTDFPGRWLPAVVGVAAFQFSLLVLLSIWRMQNRPAIYGVTLVARTALYFGLSIVFVVALAWGWQGVVVGQLIAFATFAVVAFVVLVRAGLLVPSFSWPDAKTAIAFGAPLIPHAVASWVLFATDRLFITNMIGTAELGIYAAGYQIANVVGVLQNSFNQAWVPWFYARLREGDSDVDRSVVRITYAYFVALLAVVGVVTLLAPVVVPWIVGPDFAGAEQFVGWIALGFGFNGMYKMASNYFFYVERTVFLGASTVLAAILNVFLNWALIRANGSLGAAQATAASLFVSFLIVWAVAARIHRMPWRAALLRSTEKVG
ncbi:MAG: oligosaccharide flippase family protein [Acidimicrobiia bacterium]|nr:oligosaccharide flippase family protein [Acidimicrobiia bacterium]